MSKHGTRQSRVKWIIANLIKGNGILDRERRSIGHSLSLTQLMNTRLETVFQQLASLGGKTSESERADLTERKPESLEARI